MCIYIFACLQIHNFEEQNKLFSPKVELGPWLHTDLEQNKRHQTKKQLKTMLKIKKKHFMPVQSTDFTRMTELLLMSREKSTGWCHDVSFIYFFNICFV